MSTGFESNDRRIDRMAGCATLGFFAWKWLVRLLILVWIILLAVIFFCLFSMNYYKIFWGNSQNLRTKSLIKDLQVGLTNFKLEYQRYPVPTSKDVVLRSEGKMIQSLLGKEKETNWRAIKFIDLPLAEDGKYGLTGITNFDAPMPVTIKVTDTWGEMFYLLMDDSSDELHRFSNPEYDANADHKVTGKNLAPKFLYSFTLIFSSGPDRDPKTWNDNICSWR